MSFSKTKEFQEMKRSLQERSQASREEHAQAMAAAEIEKEADLSGSTLLSPAEFKFAMATGVDPQGAYTDEREEDR
ncbi:hypothetical protein ACGYLO_11180 [Sulfitobacter sp. 1A13353]|uniref:hypothetical protein n=1 Tax=Sulfitobacter sp. 1A13353 TaxID=3368568 RepID=UPI003745E954